MEFISELLNEGYKETIEKWGATDEVIDFVNRFKTLVQRNRIVDQNEKNIDWWAKNSSFEEFKLRVSEIESTPSKREKKSQIPHGARFITAIDSNGLGRFEVWNISTYQAAKHMGRFYGGISAIWCISTDNAAYWNNYQKTSDFVFLINKDLCKQAVAGSDNPMVRYAKVAVQVIHSPIEYEDNEDIIYWDKDDKSFNESDADWQNSDFKRDLPTVRAWVERNIGFITKHESPNSSHESGYDEILKLNPVVGSTDRAEQYKFDGSYDEVIERMKNDVAEFEHHLSVNIKPSQGNTITTLEAIEYPINGGTGTSREQHLSMPTSMVSSTLLESVTAIPNGHIFVIKNFANMNISSLFPNLESTKNIRIETELNTPTTITFSSDSKIKDAKFTCNNPSNVRIKIARDSDIDYSMFMDLDSKYSSLEVSNITRYRPNQPSFEDLLRKFEYVLVPFRKVSSGIFPTTNPYVIKITNGYGGPKFNLAQFSNSYSHDHKVVGDLYDFVNDPSNKTTVDSLKDNMTKSTYYANLAFEEVHDVVSEGFSFIDNLID